MRNLSKKHVLKRYPEPSSTVLWTEGSLSFLRQYISWKRICSTDNNLWQVLHLNCDDTRNKRRASDLLLKKILKNKEIDKWQNESKLPNIFSFNWSFCLNKIEEGGIATWVIVHSDGKKFVLMIGIDAIHDCSS